MSTMVGDTITQVEKPKRIAKLPVDKHGYPVPWFVAWVDGVPDFRLVAPNKIDKAVQNNLCWICGTARSRRSVSAFVIGSMCAVNRVAPEPPSHPDCAVYSAKACPFLSTPNMVRRRHGIEDKQCAAGGVPILRNPGVALVWHTRAWTVEDIGNGLLWFLGDPVEVNWFSRGRPATRAEVRAALDSGLPLLQDAASAQSPQALRELGEMLARALTLLPPA